MFDSAAQTRFGRVLMVVTNAVLQTTLENWSNVATGVNAIMTTTHNNTTTTSMMQPQRTSCMDDTMLHVLL